MSERDFHRLKVNHKENSMKPNKNQGITKPSKKRMATSPAKGDIVKRSAFGDLTNALKVNQNPIGFGKENPGRKVARKPTIATRRSFRVQKKQNEEEKESNTITNDDSEEQSLSQKIASVTLSLPSSQKSLPSSLTKSQESHSKSSFSTTDEYADALDSFTCSQTPTAFYKFELSPSRKDLDHDDLDEENVDNPCETPVYALVIFEYMRARVKQFTVRKYLTSQKEITADMRAILVDWMVEVQENFELNHETLYLAVKLVDLYLQNKQSSRDSLQLIGATTLLIAAKFDERHPPYIDDFLYICDDAYNRKQILSMERAVLYAVGFDINIPISYRFLRRYAKCSKTNMQTLTLARFALELSLHCYDFVDINDSLMAAAALWLAFKMNNNGEWTNTLVYYSSHQESVVLDLSKKLNSMIVESKGKKLQTVWQKYSHSIFYEVAKTPTLTEERIQTEEERIRKNETSTEHQSECQDDASHPLHL